MKLNRTLKSLIIVGIIFLFILGAVAVLKNVFLQQINKQIQPTLNYTQMHMKIFPPSLVIEDVRSVSTSPFFSAAKISVSLSFQALFTREKPFHVIIEKPVMRIYSALSDQEAQEKETLELRLPFSLERGWIIEGELYYWGEETRLQATGINAAFQQKREQFNLLAESESVSFYSINHPAPLQGRVNFFIEGQKEDIQIRRLRISSPSGFLRAQGTMSDLQDPQLHLKTSFDIQSDLIARLLRLPFDWEGRATGQGDFLREEGQIQFDADFSSRTIRLNGVDMGKVDGNVDFSRNEGGTVDVRIQRRELDPERLEIRFKEKKVLGEAFGVHIDPVMDFLSLSWPVSSGTWGFFSVENKRLNVDAEFRGDLQKEDPVDIPIQGRVRVDWDGRKGVTFNSENLVTPFAEMKAEGIVHIGKSIDILLQGNVSDVDQARRFTSVVLDKALEFPEIRGAGEASFRIYGDINSPDIWTEFSLSPAGFDRFDAQVVRGQVDIIKNQFTGSFEFDDPSAKGNIRILPGQSGIKAEIEISRGAVEYILPLLDVSLPLEGDIRGRFDLLEEEKGISLTGDFSSASLDFIGQPMTNVQGRVSWEEDTLSLTGLDFEFRGGRMGGSVWLAFSRREFDFDFAAEGVQLSEMLPSLEGALTLNLKGRGAFGQDFATGKFALKPLLFKPFQPTEAEGEIRFGIDERKISIFLDGNFLPGENEFFVSLNIPLVAEMLSGEIRGSFSNWNLLLPWDGTEGKINYLGEIKGFPRSLELKGGIDFQGPILPIPRFAHALRDYSGLIFVENGILTLRALQGKLGGGDVQGQGIIEIGKSGLELVDLKMTGQNLLLSPLERTRILADGEMNLIKDADRFVLAGDFYIRRLSWQRELDERFVFYSTPYFQSNREPEIFDDLNLNIRLHSGDNAWMENSLGRIRGRLDLTLSGNIRLPVVLGDIEAVEGHVFFQDRKFDILRGLVSFSNPLTIEPYLSFTGETYVKDYRVTFSLDGLLDKLNPEFSSSPPLPPEDVLALLALGESFRRTYSYDRSTQQSTASLVSFQLSEQAKRSADKLFRLDRFRIDPFVLGSSAEMTARLTLGKRISRNFFILYSTNLTTQREEITRIEWELTNDLSIVSTRDEKGRISIDVKIHKRF